MNKSDIFDSFVKIALDKGIISNESSGAAEKKLKKTHRADSLDISAIEALYGTKPNLPKDMEYTRNIVEDAHPNSVVIAPSYDKLHGLVENVNERQDIILNIVNKQPDGHLTQRKYAEKEFILSLVRLGNDLDQKNNEQLMTLADTCLEQISQKSIVKNAVFPWLAAGVVSGISALLGGLWVQQHLPMIDEGFQKNHDKLIGEIDDLLDSNSNWGVGVDYNDNFKNMMQEFKNHVMNFYDLYQKIIVIINRLETPKSAIALYEIAQQSSDDVMQANKALRAVIGNMRPYLESIENNFTSESYKNRQIEDKGFISSLVDKMDIFHGGKGLVADDFEDVARALKTYKKSIVELGQMLENSKSFEKDAKEKLEQAARNDQADFGSGSPIPKPNKSSPPILVDKKEPSGDAEIAEILSGNLENIWN